MSERASNNSLVNASMSPEARNFYENIFLPRYRKFEESINRTPLAVLIWGPGSSGGDLHNKRKQIRDRLRELGHAAIFSEEIDADYLISDLSAKARELLQAMAADFIVLLQASPGSIAEAHDFAEFIQEIGSKMLIFIDERSQEGYSYTGALQELRILYNNVETYEYPRDIRECHLIEVIQRKIGVLQVAKWRSSLR